MTHQELLVVDDDAGIRKLLSQNLRAAGYDILLAADGSEAMKIISERSIAMLLLDIGLPGPDGLAVLEAVRRDMDVPVLMISARGRELDRARALDLGADDYLTKPFGAMELLARVRALLRRTTAGARTPHDAYRYAGLEVDFAARRARLDGKAIPLTAREFEVLAYLAHNAGKVLLHRQVLQAVWGGAYADEVDYVWTFVQRIRHKIEPDRQHPKYVLTVPGVGYWMPTPDEENVSGTTLETTASRPL